jgi:hypothetical protein
MTTVEMTYQRTVKVWWSFTWRLMLMLLPFWVGGFKFEAQRVCGSRIHS